MLGILQHDARFEPRNMALPLWRCVCHRCKCNDQLCSDQAKIRDKMQIATASKTLQGGNDYGAWDLVPIIMHGGSDYDDCGNDYGGVPP